MNAVMTIKRKYIPAPNETPEQRRTREAYADPEAFVKLAHKWDEERQQERKRYAEEKKAEEDAKGAKEYRKIQNARARRREVLDTIAVAVGGLVMAATMSAVVLLFGG